jgi:hypothetical protein
MTTLLCSPTKKSRLFKSLALAVALVVAGCDKSPSTTSTNGDTSSSSTQSGGGSAGTADGTTGTTPSDPADIESLVNAYVTELESLVGLFQESAG